MENSNETASRGKYLFAAFLAPFIWGFMSIPVRWIRGYPAEDILYFRIITALLILWIYLLLFRRKTMQADIRKFQLLPRAGKLRQTCLTLLASAFIFGNWFTYIYAVNHISIQSAALAYLTLPLDHCGGSLSLTQGEANELAKNSTFYCLWQRLPSCKRFVT